MEYNRNDGQHNNEHRGFSGGIERQLDPSEPMYRAFSRRAQQAFEKLKKTSYTGIQRFNYTSKYKGFE